MTGYYSDCTAGNGTFDMSGNLAEWLEDWSQEFPGHALTGGFHGYCEVCYEGDSCHACDPDNPGDYESMEGGLNCFVGGRVEEIFQPNQGRPYLGTRCCLEHP